MCNFCVNCGNRIPDGRLKAIPGVETCVQCSGTEKVAGFRVITGKSTYTELDIVCQRTYQELTKMQNRHGSVAAGVCMMSYNKAQLKDAIVGMPEDERKQLKHDKVI